MIRRQRMEPEETPTLKEKIRRTLAETEEAHLEM